MKKVISILLFLCLFLPFTGTYLWLQHRKMVLKKEVKRELMARVDMEELVLLKFSKKETQTKLKWHHSKEFEFEGNMYDIVRKKNVGDVTYYYCWLDKKETKLNNKLLALTLQALGKDPHNRQKQNLLSYFFKTLYSQQTTFSETETFIVLQKNNFHYQGSFSSITLPPLVAPPQLG